MRKTIQMPIKEACECGDIRKGSIYHSGPLMSFWLECPICHKQQLPFETMLLNGLSMPLESPRKPENEENA